jgi:hypothetical protein
MDVMRSISALTVGGILVASLLAGPLVGAVDLSPAEERAIPGDGDAKVEIISVPSEGRLVPRGYADSGYLLSVLPATVEVSNLSGRPMLVYELRIRSVGYVASTTHFLDESFSGRQTLTLESAVLNRTSLPRETYRGELLVIKRAHERDTVIYRGNVTLQVDQ